MRCLGCNATIELEAFPGARVACAACGATNVVPAPTPATGGLGGPYRSAAEPPGAVHPAGPSATREHVASCARGHGPLREEARGMKACDACGGQLVDHDVLATLIEAQRPVASPEPREAHKRVTSPGWEKDEHPLRCPECAGRLDRMNFGRRSGILVDVCAEHGTWFDAGELEDVLVFVGTGGIEEELATRKPEGGDGERLRQVLDAQLRADTAAQEQVVREITDLVGLLTGRRRWRGL
jgi:Zn-finger nucleic acid-binding protein